MGNKPFNEAKMCMGPYSSLSSNQDAHSRGEKLTPRRDKSRYYAPDVFPDL